MINRVRTLLANQLQGGYAWDFPGEEFVDPLFQSKKLPLHLRRLHQTLFGRAPDRLFVNYRLRQLMSVLHSTELEEHVRTPDPRVTYWPLSDEALFETAFAAEAVQISGPTTTLYVSGVHDADEGLGHAQQTWRVEVLSENTVEIAKQRPRATTLGLSYAVSGGLTLPLSLSGSGLFLRFHTAPAGTAWLVHSNGRPKSDIGQILSRLENSLGDEGVSQLFPPPLAEPVSTLRRVWDSHPYFVYRFSALLLAAVAQIEELPQDL